MDFAHGIRYLSDVKGNLCYTIDWIDLLIFVFDIIKSHRPTYLYLIAIVGMYAVIVISKLLLLF